VRDVTVLRATGQVLIGGSSSSSNLPTAPDVLMPDNPQRFTAGVIGRLSATGGIDFLTYYRPGGFFETVTRVAADSAGNLYATTDSEVGVGRSNGSIGSLSPGATDERFRLRYVAHGVSDDVAANGLAVMPDGTAFFAGGSNTAVTTTQGTVSATAPGGRNGFVMRIGTGANFLSLQDVSLAEGDSGEREAIVLATLTSVSAADILFAAATTLRGSATYADFEPNNQYFAILAGQLSTEIPVVIHGDALDETDEYLTVDVNLPPDNDTTLADGSARVDIVDDDAPPQASVVAVTPQVIEGQVANFEVRLSAPSGRDVVVHVATEDVTTGDDDYEIWNEDLLIAAGQVAVPLLTRATADGIDERDVETFRVRISAPTNVMLAPGGTVATMSLLDADPTPTLRLTPAPSTQVEGVGGYALRMWLSGVSDRPVTFRVATEPDTAVAADYIALSRDITIDPNGNERFVDVDIVDDALDEADFESFRVRATNLVNAVAPAGGAVGVFTIADNDAPPTLSVRDGGCTVTEGDAGSVPCEFVVQLSGASGKPVTFKTRTAGGSATAGADFTAQSSTDRGIAAGALSLTVPVAVLADLVDEPNEAFTLQLTDAVNASPGSLQATGTIIDNDGAPSLSIDDATTVEGNGLHTLVLTARLQPASTQTVTLNWNTADVTALAGSDYDTAGGTVTFPPGIIAVPVEVAIRGDTQHEADETFRANLSMAVNATIGDGMAVVTLLDDDEAAAPRPGTVQLDVAAASVREDDERLLLHVRRVGGDDGMASVRARTVGNSAAPGLDYIAFDETLVWADGDSSDRKVGISILPIAGVQADRQFSVVLEAATGAGAGVPASATIRIVDVDAAVFENGFESP
jgi:hypothetical protein